MKKVKQKTISAGPRGCRLPGEHLLEDEEAEALVDSGAAEMVEDDEVAAELEEKADPDPVIETTEAKQEGREEATTRTGKPAAGKKPEKPKRKRK